MCRASPDSVQVTDLVWEAMLEAARTCTTCGRPGVHRRDTRGGYVTRCEEHARPLDDAELSFLATVAAPETEDVPVGDTHAAVSNMLAESISRTHLTAEALAVLLDVTESEVYRVYVAGDIIGVRGEDVEVVYPRWQLQDDARLIPGLAGTSRRILDSCRPLDVRAMMLRPTEDLRGMSPVGWLAACFPVSAVTALLGEERIAPLPERVDRPRRGNSDGLDFWHRARDGAGFMHRKGSVRGISPRCPPVGAQACGLCSITCPTWQSGASRICTSARRRANDVPLVACPPKRGHTIYQPLR